MVKLSGYIGYTTCLDSEESSGLETIFKVCNWTIGVPDMDDTALEKNIKEEDLSLIHI